MYVVSLFQKSAYYQTLIKSVVSDAQLQSCEFKTGGKSPLQPPAMQIRVTSNIPIVAGQNGNSSPFYPSTKR